MEINVYGTLSKTQLTKFKKAVRASFVEGDKESIREAFARLYPPFKDYDAHLTDNVLSIYLKNTDPEEEKRKLLRSKLRNAIRMKSHGETDPCWAEYHAVKRKVPVNVPVPTPDEVRKEKEFFLKLSNTFKAGHPLRTYFELCMA